MSRTRIVKNLVNLYGKSIANSFEHKVTSSVYILSGTHLQLLSRLRNAFTDAISRTVGLLPGYISWEKKRARERVIFTLITDTERNKDSQEREE